MPDNKKHHFVPKFYLKRFSENKKSINAFLLKSERRVTNANLANQCYRNYFYGTEPDIERQLGVLENEASRILREIEESNILPTDSPTKASEDLTTLFLFVIMQGVRTAQFADQVDELNNAMIQRALGAETNAQTIDASEFKIGQKEPALIAMSIALAHYPLLLDLDIRLLINRTSEGFITSDNPVVMYNQLMQFRNDGLSDCGYAVKGLQFFFPIDEKRMLVLYDTDVYRVRGTKASTVELNDRRDVIALNTLQACSASEVIYFRNVGQDVEALHRKAKPFYRTDKIKEQVFKNGSAAPARRQEFVLTSRSDIRTDVTFEFMTLRRAAKQWREWYRKGEFRPSITFRSEIAVQQHRRFTDLVEQGVYHPAEFLKFLEAEGRAAQT